MLSYSLTENKERVIFQTVIPITGTKIDNTGAKIVFKGAISVIVAWIAT